MIKVFVFHIDLTFTVAMVTENGHQNRLKWTKYHFEPYRQTFKLFDMSTAKYQKDLLIFHVYC